MSIILFGKKEQEMLLMAHVVLLLPAKCQRRRRWRAYFTVHLGRDLFGMYKIHRRMQEFESSQRHAGRINKHPRAETSGTNRPCHADDLFLPHDCDLKKHSVQTNRSRNKLKMKKPFDCSSYYL
jgi:hypothetical protein